MTDRAVSVTLNYILALAIAAVLVTGLLIAGGNFVQDNRERVITSELSVIGNHIAGNMEQVDRLVEASDDGQPEEAYISQSFQRQVTGSTYTVELVENGDGPAQIVLNSTRPDVSVRVNTTVNTDVENSRADSGAVVVRYDEDEDALVIDND